jgi:hypothetical protein
MAPTATQRTPTQRVAEHKEAAPEHAPDHGLLHFPSLHVPHVPVPSLHVGVPSGTPGRVLWWGGLAAVAAFGVVDWPVVGLVAVGTWVAEQHARADGEEKAEEPQAKQP